MEYKITKFPGSQVEIEFKIPTEEWASYIQKTQTLSEAAQSLMKEKYLEFLGKGEIEPIAPAQTQIIKMVPGSPAEFKVMVPILPTIGLADDYGKDLSEVERKPVRVTDKEMEEALESLRKARAKLTDLAQPAVKGNLITIKFFSAQLPSPAPHQDGFILGEGQLLPGFEDKLVGLKAGEKKELSLMYPSTGPLEAQRGKPITFQVEVLKVQEVKWPELTDHFAQELGVKDLAELKETLKNNLTSQKEKTADEAFRSQLLEKIGQEIKIEIPSILIEAEQNRLLENLKKAVQNELKTSFAQYLQETGKTEKEILNSFLDLAQANVRQFLLLKTVGQKEKLEVKPEEIEQELAKILKTMPEERQKSVDQEALKRYLKSSLLAEKVFQKLENYWKKI